jgi:hypothetical protein
MWQAIDLPAGEPGRIVQLARTDLTCRPFEIVSRLLLPFMGSKIAKTRKKLQESLKFP